MLQAAKEHISRVQENKKQEAASHIVEIVDKPIDVAKVAKEQNVEMEIPLPPLPAAKDKDPTAMVDTRFHENRDFMKKQKFEMEKTFEHSGTTNDPKNLPPGFNPNVKAVIVQNTEPINPPALQGPTHAPPYYGHYGGPPSHHYPPQMHGQQSYFQQNQRPHLDTNDKADNREEPDAAELAMLGIDPSDFAGFGS